MANSLKLRERMEPGWVIQGEIYGEGVQANPLKVRGRHLAVFGMFNNSVPVPLAQWPSWVQELAAPTLDLDFANFESVDQLVAAIEEHEVTGTFSRRYRLPHRQRRRTTRARFPWLLQSHLEQVPSKASVNARQALSSGVSAYY